MNTAAELRRQVESALGGRFPAALSPRPLGSPERLSCGLPGVDTMLGGGFPLGSIAELAGVHSSGRTTLTLSTLAQATAAGESCAYVDATDALDPASAAALGVDLRRLLWIRTAEAHTGKAAMAAGSSPFPAAMAAHPPRPVWTKNHAPWTRLDQALRATDLLLSTGGFRVIVLDMGDVALEQARRVPLATWYRFRLLAEQSRTLLLLMTQVASANSCAAVSLSCGLDAARWPRAVESSPRLLAGLQFCLRVERHRAMPMRKQPVATPSTLWKSRATWAG